MRILVDDRSNAIKKTDKGPCMAVWYSQKYLLRLRNNSEVLISTEIFPLIK